MESMVKLFGDTNVLQVATFGTLSSRNAIKTACRGLGISVDVGQEMSNCVKIDRGFTYTIKDCLEGNEQKGYSKIPEFIALAEQYPEVIEVAKELEGVIMNTSIHASGIIAGQTKYHEYNACMRSNQGSLTTQSDLKDTEGMGAIKYDFLFIAALEKIKKTMNFLMQKGYMEWQGTLRKTYDKYLHPRILDYTNQDMWDNIQNVPFLFQFEGDVGVNALKVTRPSSILDLSTANSLMRLMGEFDGLNNLERFVKYKSDIRVWYKELAEERNLNEDEIQILKKHLQSSSGLCDTQEKTMMLLMDDKISGFDLKEGDFARKVIGKKSIKDIPVLQQKYYDEGLARGTSKELLDYVWNYQIVMGLG